MAARCSCPLRRTRALPTRGWKAWRRRGRRPPPEGHRAAGADLPAEGDGSNLVVSAASNGDGRARRGGARRRARSGRGGGGGRRTAAVRDPRPAGGAAERRARRIGGQNQRVLLAALLVRANEVVSTDRLVDDLWGAAPPRTAGTCFRTSSRFSGRCWARTRL